MVLKFLTMKLMKFKIEVFIFFEQYFGGEYEVEEGIMSDGHTVFQSEQRKHEFHSPKAEQ
jgi:hypothetical protein